MITSSHPIATSRMRFRTKRLLLTGVVLGTMLTLSPTAAAADPLPGCAVTAGNPVVTLSGVVHSASAESIISCSETNTFLVLGASLTAAPGTHISNGGFCEGCISKTVRAEPVIPLGPIFCVVSKASGGAVGAVVNPPFDEARYCSPVNEP